MAVKDGEATKKRRKRPYNVSFATFPKKLEMTLPAQLQKHDDKQTRQPKTRLPDRETTMPVKDGEATPKKSLTSPLKPFRKSASTVAKNTPKSRHGSPKHCTRTRKHHASEGRRSHEEALEKSLTLPKELETTLPEATKSHKEAPKKSPTSPLKPFQKS